MKNNKLQDYFSMIRTRQELLNEIHSKEHQEEIYKNWKAARQEEFLDFCTGAKSVKVLYDTFFKEIMNPETVPEHLEKLLGLLLGKKIKVLKTLPVDSTRLGDETSLLTMDILVQLEDGTLCNIEIQKVGYLFPGQRCACYSADLLLRQYTTARSKKQEKNFRYGDMKDVYTIVLFEKSPRAFHAFKNLYKHSFEQKSDSDLNHRQILWQDIAPKFLQITVIHLSIPPNFPPKNFDKTVIIPSEPAYPVKEEQRLLKIPSDCRNKLRAAPKNKYFAHGVKLFLLHFL